MTLEAYIQQKYSATCQRTYLNSIKRYIAFMNHNALNATYQDVLHFIAYLRSTNVHPKTLRNYLFSVKIYYQWLLVTAQRDDHPCQSLYLTDPINKAIPVERLYSEQTLLQLLENHRPRTSYLYHRDKVIISLLIYQALTTREIVNLQVQDIDLAKGSVYIRHPHPKQERTLALNTKQIIPLQHYGNQERPLLLKRNKVGATYNNLILNNEGNPLNPSDINRQINQYRREDNQITALKIRQSVIKNLLKKGHDLRVVQVFAGHRRSSSTEAYKQSGLEELKNTLQKHHPLA